MLLGKWLKDIESEMITLSTRVNPVVIVNPSFSMNGALLKWSFTSPILAGPVDPKIILMCFRVHSKPQLEEGSSRQCLTKCITIALLLSRKCRGNAAIENLIPCYVITAKEEGATLDMVLVFLIINAIKGNYKLIKSTTGI